MSRRPEHFRQRAAIGGKETLEDLALGPWRAIVDDNDDPGQLGRIFVVIPDLTGAERHPVAAWPSASPMGGGLTDGKAWGSLFIPPVKATVWVEFLDGDPQELVWLPGWFGDSETPDLLRTHYPLRRGLVSPSGHYLFLDDSDGDIGDVELGHRDGAGLRFTGAGKAELRDKNGALLTLDSTVVAQSKGGAKLTLDEDASLDSKSGKLVKLNGSDGGKTVLEITVDDLQDLVKQTLNTILQAGTAGSPVKQQIVQAAMLQQAKLYTTALANYKSAKVKQGK